MNRIYWHCLSLFMFYGVAISANNLQMHYSSASSTTIIGDKEFSHVKKSDNGVKSEEYSINRVPVQKDQYYQDLHTAQLAQMNDQQQQLERRQQERDVMHDELQAVLLEKLIASLMQDFVQDLQVLEQSVLHPYLIFDKQGIRSVHDLEQMQAWSAQLLKTLKSLSKQANTVALRQMVDDLETRMEQVRSCLKKSMNQAVSQCDDTAVLKELLALIKE